MVHAVQPNAFIDAVDLLRIGAEAGDRGVLVEREEPAIGKPGRGVVAQRQARHLGEVARCRLDDRRVHVEHAGVGHEAAKFDAGLGAAERTVAPALGDDALDIGPRLRRGIAHHDADPQANARPRWH